MPEPWMYGWKVGENRLGSLKWDDPPEEVARIAWSKVVHHFLYYVPEAGISKKRDYRFMDVAGRRVVLYRYMASYTIGGENWEARGIDRLTDGYAGTFRGNAEDCARDFFLLKLYT